MEKTPRNKKSIRWLILKIVLCNYILGTCLHLNELHGELLNLLQPLAPISWVFIVDFWCTRSSDNRINVVMDNHEGSVYELVRAGE